MLHTPALLKLWRRTRTARRRKRILKKNGPLTMLENHNKKAHEEVFILTTKKQKENYYDMNLSGISKRLRLPA